MSIVALKRNSRRYKARISGQGNKGFSLNGGHRNQGWVGQGVRGRSLTGTPFRGAVPMGNGGCCGTYVQKINNRSSNCCTNDPNIVKRSTMNTLGHIDSTVIYPTSVFSESCRDGKCPNIQNWVKDFSPLNHSEGQRIFKVARQSGKCVNLKDDAGLDTCHRGCKSASYHIGGKKVVREMYSKNLNMLAVGSEEYQRTSLMSTVNLPTPDCKKPYPMGLNHTGSCQKNFMTSDDAIKGGVLPHDWMNCNKCLNPGMNYITHLDSQHISTQTPLIKYTDEQKKLLDGQLLFNNKKLPEPEPEPTPEPTPEPQVHCKTEPEPEPSPEPDVLVTWTGDTPPPPYWKFMTSIPPLDNVGIEQPDLASPPYQIATNGTDMTLLGSDIDSHARFWSDQTLPTPPAWTGMSQFVWNLLLTRTSTESTLHSKRWEYVNNDGNQYEHLLFFAFPLPANEPLTFNKLYSVLAEETNKILANEIGSEIIIHQISQGDSMFSVLDDDAPSKNGRVNVRIPSCYCYGYLLDSTDSCCGALVATISNPQ